MPVKPMLGDLELQTVAEIESDQDRVLAQHGVPGLEGDFLQELGRRATTFTLNGVIAGEGVSNELKGLRDKFHSAEPVPFASDISTATRVTDVLIEEMGVRELAGKTELFEYDFTLREYVPGPPVPIEPPPVIVPPEIPVDVGRLEVEVIVEGQPNFDFSRVVVTVANQSLNRTLTNRTGNVWTETEFPPGTYQARAFVPGQPELDNQELAVVLPARLTHVIIRLRPGQTTPTATMFVVHFHFDNAFVEPCMRPVLEQVEAFALSHPDQKMLVVGHTDLTGSDQYNQSLSERRARSVFAFLTSGTDPAGARAEWNELRKARPGGSLFLRDGWGRRVHQWMLRDLGLYQGNIDTQTPRADDGALLDQAVRRFQSEHGLAVDGVVGDDTWPVLIDEYFNVRPLRVPTSQLLPNARNACNSGSLKWLGCGEKDPIFDRNEAIRQNRRAEILFVRTNELPADVARPDTFDLPTPGAVNPSWCLNPSNVTTRTCFVTTRIIDPPGNPPQPKENCTNPPENRLIRQPAEPGSLNVSGRVAFEDGTPLGNTEYVLTAPDGQMFRREHRPPSDPLRGWPIPERTALDGSYSAGPCPVGIFSFEVRARVVAYRRGAPVSTAKGNVVCSRLDTANSIFDISVVGLAAASVRPAITLGSNTVVMVKPGCTPTRQTCRLSTDNPFTGSGRFTRSSDAVKFFDAAIGGNEISFDGVDNVFTDAQLTAGVTLFMEGAHASTAVDAEELRLALTVGGQPGFAEVARLTALELTLDVFESRTSFTTDPPAVADPLKIVPGRFLQAAIPGFPRERAMVIVRPPNPAGFAGELELTSVNDQLRVFDAGGEFESPGETALVLPLPIPPATIPADGLKLFVEGVRDSSLAQEAGLFLGIRNVEREGDRVAFTVGTVELTETASQAAPRAAAVRIGLWDDAFNGPADAPAAPGSVRFNQPDPNNFVAGDSRRFFLRLHDASRAGAGRVDVEWRTLMENGDGEPTNPPAGAPREMTLLENPANSGRFLSPALMLVTDDDDQRQSVHDGLPGGSVQVRNSKNHRLRRASIRSSVSAEYSGAGGARVSWITPVFGRNPEARRRVQLEVFVLRNAAFPNGIVDTTPETANLWNHDLRFAQECYARLGIEFETIVRPGTPANMIRAENRRVSSETIRTSGPGAFTVLRPPVVRDPSESFVLTRGGVQTTLSVVENQAPQPGQVQLDRNLGRLTLHPSQAPARGDRLVATYVSRGFRAVLMDTPNGVNLTNATVASLSLIGAARPFVAGDRRIRVFFVGGFTDPIRGAAFPDAQFTGHPNQGACFVRRAVPPPDANNLSHEIGHVLSNKSSNISGGHYVQPVPPGRLFTPQNLMRAGTDPFEGVTTSKRLWDALDGDLAVNQFRDMRRSLYTRGF